MLTDAIDNLYDNAILISADSDLTPAVEAIKKYFPQKRLVLYFPPKRKSASLKKVCHRFAGSLGETLLAKSQFPDIVSSKTGYPLKRPEKWR